MTTDVQTTDVDVAAHAVVREAVSLLVDGDPDLALWALIRETTWLAGVSCSGVSLADAHQAYCLSLNRLECPWPTG